jgi:hypothetical protein
MTPCVLGPAAGSHAAMCPRTCGLTPLSPPPEGRAPMPSRVPGPMGQLLYLCFPVG